MIAVTGLVAVIVIVGAVLLSRGLPTTSAQTALVGPGGWTVTSYTGGPRLAVDRTVVDEGNVAYEHTVTATYRLKNVGDQPLNLQKPTVQTLEGC